MSIQSPTTRNEAADVAVSLGLLVAGGWVLAIAAPLISALAVLLALGLYLPLRVRTDKTPAG